ncbi:MAG: hypothetical protein MUF37_01975 [Methanoregulaceae archaeon]|jgi:hypothetical protein|nr:hypothetical protein [Methanoregulaceae archaeon]
MEKQNAIFIGIVAIIIIFLFGLFYLNGMMFPDSKQTGQTDAAKLSFSVETAVDDAYLTFRYVPAGTISSPVTATYQAQKDSKVLFNDQKTFASVSPDNPIEIAMKMSDNGNYTMIMLISDKGKNLVHQSSTTYYGLNQTSSTNQATI